MIAHRKLTNLQRKEEGHTHDKRGVEAPTTGIQLYAQHLILVFFSPIQIQKNTRFGFQSLGKLLLKAGATIPDFAKSGMVTSMRLL